MAKRHVFLVAAVMLHVPLLLPIAALGQSPDRNIPVLNGTIGDISLAGDNYAQGYVFAETGEVVVSVGANVGGLGVRSTLDIFDIDEFEPISGEFVESKANTLAFLNFGGIAAGTHNLGRVLPAVPDSSNLLSFEESIGGNIDFGFAEIGGSSYQLPLAIVNNTVAGPSLADGYDLYRQLEVNLTELRGAEREAKHEADRIATEQREAARLANEQRLENQQTEYERPFVVGELLKGEEAFRRFNTHSEEFRFTPDVINRIDITFSDAAAFSSQATGNGASVPEPNSMVATMLFAATLGCSRRRRSQHSASWCYIHAGG